STVNGSDLYSLVQQQSLACVEKPLQTPLVRFPILWRDDGVGHPPADCFLPRPAEDSFSFRVPFSNLTRGIHRNNGVQRGLKNRADPLLALLELPEKFLSPLLSGVHSGHPSPVS